MNQYIGNTANRYNQQLFENRLNTNSQFQPQIAQIADEDSHLETIPTKKYTIAGLSTDVVLRRYKIRICSMHDSTTPVEQLPWAYAKLSTSGLRRESCGITYYPVNTYVTVFQDDATGNYYIDDVHPNSLPNPPNDFQNACKPGSGIKPGSLHYELPDTACKPEGNGVANNSQTHLTVPSKHGEKQSKLGEEAIELGVGCKKVNTEAINKEISKLIKDSVSHFTEKVKRFYSLNQVNLLGQFECVLVDQVSSLR